MRPRANANAYLRRAYVIRDGERVASDDIMVEVAEHQAMNMDFLDLSPAERRKFKAAAEGTSPRRSAA